MQFNQEYFDAGLYRMNTRSIKWDGCRAEHGADTLPMWVADMDFPSPPAVQQALLTRAAHPTYCYTDALGDDHQALIDFWARRHSLHGVKPEHLLSLPCVVTGLKLCINALTQPGDKVIILSPVYGPFRMSLEATGRTVVELPLIRKDNGRYDLDFTAMEQALKDGAKLLLLCNPHNPVSRCWTRQEMQHMVDLAAKYGMPIASDEIHADFVYAPNQFTPILTLTQKNVVSLCAPSKTFNLAGLQQASAICMDEALRTKLQAQLNASGIVSGNIFALEATRAAYNEGDAWLDGLLDYLAGNIAELERCVRQYLPKAVLTPMEATYLGWLDLRAYGFTTDQLMERCFRHGVAFTGGTFFGAATGEGHLRINIGCPRSHIEEAIRRLAEALQ